MWNVLWPKALPGCCVCVWDIRRGTAILPSLCPAHILTLSVPLSSAQILTLSVPLILISSTASLLLHSVPHEDPVHFKPAEINDFPEPHISLGSAASGFIKGISQSAFFRGIKSLQGVMPQTFPPNYPELEGSIALSHFILQWLFFMDVI